MSQQGKLSQQEVLETLTGNVGGPVGPDGAGNINVIGSAPILVTGNPGTNTLTISDDGTIPLQFTEDSGTATPAANNLNVFGDATQGSITAGAGDTITITNSDASTTQKGVLETATDAEAVAVTLTNVAIVPSNLGPVFASPPPIGFLVPNTGKFTRVDVDNLRLDGNTLSSTNTNGDIVLQPDGTGTVNIDYATPNAVAIYGTSGALSEVGPLTDGQLVIGSTGSAPVAGAITSTGGSIDVSLGAGTINIETAGTIAASFPTDSGTAVPAAGALTIAGGTLLGTTGVGSTVTINADDNVVGSVAGDSGTVTPTSNSFTIAGGTLVTTSGSGDTLTINADGAVVASFPTDSGTATPAANALTIAGGSNINTSGAGAIVTVNLDTNISVGTIDCTQVTIDPGASGDSFVQFNINTTGEFRIGVDDDASDAFKISQGSALGTNDTQVITAAGEVTFPLTPAFLATHTVTQSNVTGNGANATVNFTTEIFDQNSDYDGTNTFMAPVTGRYLFQGALFINNATGATKGQLNLVTSNRTYVGNASGVFSTSDFQFVVSVLADMDAGDSAILQGVVSGLAGDTADFPSSASNSYFSGSLQC